MQSTQLKLISSRITAEMNVHIIQHELPKKLQITLCQRTKKIQAKCNFPHELVILSQDTMIVRQYTVYVRSSSFKFGLIVNEYEQLFAYFEQTEQKMNSNLYAPNRIEHILVCLSLIKQFTKCPRKKKFDTLLQNTIAKIRFLTFINSLDANAYFF